MALRLAVLAMLGASWSLPQAHAAEEPQVVLEVRLVTVPEPFFERIGIDFEIKTNNFPDKPLPQVKPAGKPAFDLNTVGHTFLTDEQVFCLMEAMQGERRANVLQFPRMTLSSDQAGSIEMTETKYFLTRFEWTSVDGQPRPLPKNEPFKIGNQVWAKPTVSADRRNVQLAFKLHRTDLVASGPLVPVQVPVAMTNTPSPEVMFQMFLQQPQFSTIAVEKTLTIPAGQTAVLGGLKKTVETRSETSVPIVSRIPYMNRLFRTVAIGQETQTLLVLVTPRIVGETESSTGTIQKSASR